MPHDLWLVSDRYRIQHDSRLRYRCAVVIGSAGCVVLANFHFRLYSPKRVHSVRCFARFRSGGLHARLAHAGRRLPGKAQGNPNPAPEPRNQHRALHRHAAVIRQNEGQASARRSAGVPLGTAAGHPNLSCAFSEVHRVCTTTVRRVCASMRRR